MNLPWLFTDLIAVRSGLASVSMSIHIWAYSRGKVTVLTAMIMVKDRGELVS